jgi:hypothetical protein
MNLSQTTFSPEDIQSTQPAMKIGLLATVIPDGMRIAADGLWAVHRRPFQAAYPE